MPFNTQLYNLKHHHESYRCKRLERLHHVSLAHLDFFNYDPSTCSASNSCIKYTAKTMNWNPHSQLLQEAHVHRKGHQQHILCPVIPRPTADTVRPGSNTTLSGSNSQVGSPSAGPTACGRAIIQRLSWGSAKLLGTSASLLVTSALLVVTRSY